MIYIEKWKDIPKYEGLYQVSSCGRVKSLNYLRTGKERIMKQRNDTLGYKQVLLYNNGRRKSFVVHRLVALAFLDNPNNYPCVNHIDECKYNNYVENLEWCTYEYNNTYGTRLERISEANTGEKNPRTRKVQCINTGEIFNTLTEAAEWSKTHRSSIAKQIKGKLKYTGKHPVTKEKLQWKYVK